MKKTILMRRGGVGPDKKSGLSNPVFQRPSECITALLEPMPRAALPAAPGREPDMGLH